MSLKHFDPSMHSQLVSSSSARDAQFAEFQIGSFRALVHLLVQTTRNMPTPRQKGRRARQQSSSESEVNNSSYYARNITARRQYQVQYNRVQRVTRRKVGKAQLAALQEKKRQELNGVRSVFKNTLYRKDGALDPDRSTCMTYREGITVKYMQFRRTSLSDEFSGQNDPNGWINEYMSELVQHNDIELREIRRYLKVTSDVKGSSDWNEMVHGARRLIAVCHQEKELIMQGIDIPLLAWQSNASIAQGYW
ncbi:hypothetical protein QCA50_019355 [Cerrena zonata]|uniref:Uncharacterized protein n=1 Tax=Cerrena zonata TaxID=2478898 RepID=A0AAW0FHQ1_9APHY